jgi:iron complex transport system substrate-binding protein
MRKLWIAALVCLLGCGGNNGEGTAGGETAAAETADSRREAYWRRERRGDSEYLVDLDGNEIPLTQYRRIVVLSPGAVETLYLIGGEAAIAAIASSRDPVWPAEKTSLLPTVGNAARPNLEEVLALESDLVIGNSMNSAFLADLKTRGHLVLTHGANSIDDIFDSALLLGVLSGRRQEAEALVAQKKQELLALAPDADRGERLKGAFLYTANPPMAFTRASLAGEVLELLGVENIAADLPAAQPILSPEYLVMEDPDFLFGAMSITKPEDILAADSAILKTRAGREKNIRIVPSWFFLRPSPRLIDGLLELREELEAFKKSAAALP